MQYTNPELPEGINTTNEHPLKEFAILLGGLILLVIVAVSIISYSTNYLARFIPFQIELSLTDGYVERMDRYPAQELYLQALADKLSAAMDLPEGMEITVLYDDADILNAYATLGGNIVLYRGLLEKLPDENAVAMVMAHEIAHIKHRDPIASVGRGIAISIALRALAGLDNGGILGSAGLYTILKFNREMESAADADALLTLQRLYGHVEGAETLFQVFIDESMEKDISKLPQFFQTHPLEENRIERIQRFREDNPATNKNVTSLPEDFTRSLNETGAGGLEM